MEASIRVMADRSRGGASLADFGYTDVGLDDGWQKCGSYGPKQYTYHSAAGKPMIDTARFPDMRRMTELAHSFNLTAGWCK